jgi:hypothetical protein
VKGPGPSGVRIAPSPKLHYSAGASGRSIRVCHDPTKPDTQRGASNNIADARGRAALWPALPGGNLSPKRSKRPRTGLTATIAAQFLRRGYLGIPRATHRAQARLARSCRKRAPIHQGRPAASVSEPFTARRNEDDALRPKSSRARVLSLGLSGAGCPISAALVARPSFGSEVNNGSEAGSPGSARGRGRSRMLAVCPRALAKGLAEAPG